LFYCNLKFYTSIKNTRYNVENIQKLKTYEPIE